MRGDQPSGAAHPPVFVTGASGFVGSALVGELAAGGWNVRIGARAARRVTPPRGVEVVDDAPLESDHDWRPALSGCDCIVHTAARVHVMSEDAPDPLAAYRRINVTGTLRLARHAADAGVRRFVFLSSIKVNGERTEPGAPFTAADRPAPTDPYGISKHEAEDALLQLARAGSIELVIIRPVLVYGPGVKGNFLEMLRWLHRGLPLPLRSVRNRRSLLALGNLTDLVLHCVRAPAAANEVFLASDAESVSTPELLRRTAAALRRRARLVPFPPTLLRAAGRVTGRAQAVNRLLDSLEVDISSNHRQLGWRPPMSLDDGLRLTADWFVSIQRPRV